MKHILYIGVWTCIFFCVSPVSHSAATLNGVADSLKRGQQVAVEELPLPDVPKTLTEPSKRAAYIIAHFWDALDFSDTLRSHRQAFMEQNFSNFISVFPYADKEAQRGAVETLLTKAAVDSVAYWRLIDVAEKYLYEFDSPMFSEDYYILFLEKLTARTLRCGRDVGRYRWQLEAARKNRVGMMAANFAYWNRKGRQVTLREMLYEGMLLLVFYDPACDHCKETMEVLKAEPLVSQLVSEGQLTVLAVYSGEERLLWKETAKELPAEWTVGYETGNMQEMGAYVLRRMPTLYLLDAKKRVVLKDVRPEQLVDWFRLKH